MREIDPSLPGPGPAHNWLNRSTTSFLLTGGPKNGMTGSKPEVGAIEPRIVVHECDPPLRGVPVKAPESLPISVRSHFYLFKQTIQGGPEDGVEVFEYERTIGIETALTRQGPKSDTPAEPADGGQDDDEDKG